MTTSFRLNPVKLRRAYSSPTKAVPNRAQRVVIGWLNDQDFLTSENRPKELPVHGDSLSFAQLVSRYSGDISHGAVLDELTRIGVAELVNNTHVRLISDGYVPHDDEYEKIRILSVSTADLLTTAEHNLRIPEDPRFQRQLAYQHCTPETANDFLLYSSEKSAEFLQDLNHYLIKLQSSQAPEAEKNIRVGWGLYSIQNANSTK